MIDHVVFDLDGTLVDSAVVCVEILNEMLADRGSARVITVDSAAVHMSTGGTHMVAALLAEDCGDPLAEIAEFRNRYGSRKTPADCLFPGVREGLERLVSLGFRLAICSNKPQSLCDKVLVDTGLAPLFDIVVGGAAGLRPKPETDLMDATLRRLGVSAERCVFVGDSDLDHAVACATAVPFLFVTYGYAQSGWDAPDLVRIDSFAEVADRIGMHHAPVRRLRIGAGY